MEVVFLPHPLALSLPLFLCLFVLRPLESLYLQPALTGCSVFTLDKKKNKQPKQRKTKHTVLWNALPSSLFDPPFSLKLR